MFERFSLEAKAAVSLAQAEGESYGNGAPPRVSTTAQLRRPASMCGPEGPRLLRRDRWSPGSEPGPNALLRGVNRINAPHTLDVIGDPDKAWVGRTCELNGPTREVKDGNLSQAFPYVVDGGRGRAVVLVEDIADVPRLLRAAGAKMTTVLTLALDALVVANATLDNYRAAEVLRDAAKRNAKH